MKLREACVRGFGGRHSHGPLLGLGFILANNSVINASKAVGEVVGSSSAASRGSWGQIDFVQCLLLVRCLSRCICQCFVSASLPLRGGLKAI